MMSSIPDTRYPRYRVKPNTKGKRCGCAMYTEVQDTRGIALACLPKVWVWASGPATKLGIRCTPLPCEPWCVSLLHAVRCAQVAAFCASRSDDGWLCACLQHHWKGKGALQARDGCKCNPVPSCTATQMSFELRLGALLAGMMAGCVLVCSTTWRGRMHGTA